MADQTNNDVLNRLVARLYRSLLQYTVECWPWTTSTESADGKSPEEKTVEQMAARQLVCVGRLVDRLQERGEVVDFGNYPDYSELHYVALDYLLGKLIADEEKLVTELEAARVAIHDDPLAAGLLNDLLAAEKENVSRLRELAAKAAAGVPA
jgi:hypothetical protein